MRDLHILNVDERLLGDGHRPGSISAPQNDGKFFAADASHFREKDLKNHFETPDSSGQAETPQQEKKFSLDEEALGDYQLIRALDLLKGWKILAFSSGPRRIAGTL